MPWTKRDYPPSMKNLPTEVRNKAIDIANAVLDESGMDEGLAIATGISRAKDWAANRGKPFETPQTASNQTDIKRHGEDRYVVPHEKGWAVKIERGSEKTYRTKKEAVFAARTEAKAANATLTVQDKRGRIQSRTSYNPNKKF